MRRLEGTTWGLTTNKNLLIRDITIMIPEKNLDCRKRSRNSVLATDHQAAYKTFAGIREMTQGRLCSGRPPKGPYHLQKVNGLHSPLKGLIHPFNGVSTKIQNNFPACWQWRDREIPADLLSRREVESYRGLPDLRMALVSGTHFRLTPRFHLRQLHSHNRLRISLRRDAR